MPIASPKPCKKCRKPTRNDGGYCGPCQTRRRVDPARKQYDRKRGTAAQRGYGHKWRVRRAVYLELNPFCVDCEKKGKVVMATVVDHITPHKGDYDLFWDESNWQPMCKRCHDRKTAKEDGGLGNKLSNRVGRLKSQGQFA